MKTTGLLRAAVAPVAIVALYVNSIPAHASSCPVPFGNRPIIRQNVDGVEQIRTELRDVPDGIPCAAYFAPGGCLVPGADGCFVPGAGVGPTGPDALGPMTPGDMGPGAPYDPSPDLLAGSFGSAYGPPAPVPNMIGDFFGGGATFRGMTGPDATAMVAGGDRRFKIVEGNSPIPIDRVFFNYNHFQNALQSADVFDPYRSLDRYTFGVEKTLFNKRLSVEFRVPFAGGLNSSQHADGSTSFMATELGNLALAVKALVRQRRNYRLAIGLAIVFPTGEDARYFGGEQPGGTLEGVLENESVHLQPFLGLYWEPNDRLFALFFAQLDFDTSGNGVTVFDINGGETPLPPITDTYSDQNLGFIDLSLGYWVYKNPQASLLTGIAPVVELHYSTTLQDTDVAGYGANGPTVTNPANHMDVLNLTAGVHFQIGEYSTLTVAAAAPLVDDENEQFDSEFIVEFNRRF